MKKITVTLSDEAEKYFNEIMYSLPKEDDGSGMCTQSEAINYALLYLKNFEDIENEEAEVIEKIKLKWQKFNRDNGLSWNEVAMLVNQVSRHHTPTERERERGNTSRFKD